MTAAAALRSAIEEALGPAVTVVGFEGPEQMEWSFHFEVHVRGWRSGEVTLLAKVPRWGEAPTLDAAVAAGPQEATRLEFESLGRLHSAILDSGDPGLAAVEPVAFVEPVNAIVMTHLRSRPLQARLGLGKGGGDPAALFQRIGRWLRVLHDTLGAPEAAPGVFDAAAAVEDLRETEQVVRRKGPSPRGLLTALAGLRAKAADIDGAETGAGVIHGDLSQGNVLVSPDERVALIDPNPAPGDIHLDAAHLLADVVARRSQLASLGMLRSPEVVAGWADDAAAGHGGLNKPVLEFYRSRALIDRWVSLLGTTGSPSSWIALRAAGRVIRAHTGSAVRAEQSPE